MAAIFDQHGAILSDPEGYIAEPADPKDQSQNTFTWKPLVSEDDEAELRESCIKLGKTIELFPYMWNEQFDRY